MFDVDGEPSSSSPNAMVDAPAADIAELEGIIASIEFAP